jgi:hypothetical protein
MKMMAKLIKKTNIKLLHNIKINTNQYNNQTESKILLATIIWHQMLVGLLMSIKIKIKFMDSFKPEILCKIN